MTCSGMVSETAESSCFNPERAHWKCGLLKPQSPSTWHISKTQKRACTYSSHSHSYHHIHIKGWALVACVLNSGLVEWKQMGPWNPFASVAKTVNFRISKETPTQKTKISTCNREATQSWPDTQVDTHAHTEVSRLLKEFTFLMNCALVSVLCD